MNTVINQHESGAISSHYSICCAGCHIVKDIDVKDFKPPVIIDVDLARNAVRQGFHLMPFSPEEDKWFCTACAESRGADAKVFTAMREQAKSAAHLRAKDTEGKTRVEDEKKERTARQTMRKSIASKKAPKKTGSRGKRK